MIDVNHHLLSSLGVGHQSLDKVRQVALEHGLHAKLTGAGGGGCALVFIRSSYAEERRLKVCEALKQSGFNCYQVKLGVPGVSIEQHSS